MRSKLDFRIRPRQVCERAQVSAALRGPNAAVNDVEVAPEARAVTRAAKIPQDAGGPDGFIHRNSASPTPNRWAHSDECARLRRGEQGRRTAAKGDVSTRARPLRRDPADVDSSINALSNARPARSHMPRANRIRAGAKAEGMCSDSDRLSREDYRTRSGGKPFFAGPTGLPARRQPRPARGFFSQMRRAFRRA